MALEIEDRIAGAGLRRTRDRVQVQALLLEASRPLTHQELSRRLPDMDRVTLYRVLDALEGGGLVHRIQGMDGSWRYRTHGEETAGCPGGHPHFLCLRCGRMFCLTDQALPRVEVPEGAVVQKKQFVATGFCTACAATPDDEA